MKQFLALLKKDIRRYSLPLGCAVGVLLLLSTAYFIFLLSWPETDADYIYKSQVFIVGKNNQEPVQSVSAFFIDLEGSVSGSITAIDLAAPGMPGIEEIMEHKGQWDYFKQFVDPQILANPGEYGNFRVKTNNRNSGYSGSRAICFYYGKSKGGRYVASHKFFVWYGGHQHLVPPDKNEIYFENDFRISGNYYFILQWLKGNFWIISLLCAAFAIFLIGRGFGRRKGGMDYIKSLPIHDLVYSLERVVFSLVYPVLLAALYMAVTFCLAFGFCLDISHLGLAFRTVGYIYFNVPFILLLLGGPFFLLAAAVNNSTYYIAAAGGISFIMYTWGMNIYNAVSGRILMTRVFSPNDIQGLFAGEVLQEFCPLWLRNSFSFFRGEGSFGWITAFIVLVLCFAGGYIIYRRKQLEGA